MMVSAKLRVLYGRSSGSAGDAGASWQGKNKLQIEVKDSIEPTDQTVVTYRSSRDMPCSKRGRLERFICLFINLLHKFCFIVTEKYYISKTLVISYCNTQTQRSKMHHQQSSNQICLPLPVRFS